MPTSGNSEISIEYLPAIKENPADKRELRKLWQTMIGQTMPNLEKQIKSNHLKASKFFLDMEINKRI